MTISNTEATNKDYLRERLRNLPRTSRTDTRYPIDAYEDDLVQIIIQYGLEQRKEAEQLAQIDGALWALKDLHNQGSVTGLTYTESVKRLYERKEAITALQAKETK